MRILCASSYQETGQGREYLARIYFTAFDTDTVPTNAIARAHCHSQRPRFIKLHCMPLADV